MVDNCTSHSHLIYAIQILIKLDFKQSFIKHKDILSIQNMIIVYLNLLKQSSESLVIKKIPIFPRGWLPPSPPNPLCYSTNLNSKWMVSVHRRTLKTGDGDLLVDFSKNLVNWEVMQLLFDLVRMQNLFKTKFHTNIL